MSFNTITHEEQHNRHKSTTRQTGGGSRLWRSGWVGVVLGLLVVISGTSAHGQLLLEPGDRVVFFGDSITQQMLYTRYVQQYLLARYPEMNLTFFNAGWGGDRAPGGLRRLERDVLSLNPTVVTLFFGMNDGRGAALNDQAVKAYREGMEGIIKTLTEKKIRVMVYSPGCVDYDIKKAMADADYNRTLAALGEVGRELAEQYGCRFFDVHHPMLQVQQMQKAKNPKFTMMPDSVHPNAAGHQVMAHLMLQGLGAEPMPVIGRVDLAENAAKGVKILSHGEGKLRLETTEPMLQPYWFDVASRDMMRDCGFMRFAGAKLVVRGLPRGYYCVIDDLGQTIAKCTSEELEAGVGLDGSQEVDSKKLHDWIEAKEQNYFTAWRQMRLGNGLPASAKQVYDGMMVTDAGYAQLVRDLARPRSAGLRLTVMDSPTGPNLALHKSYESSDPNRENWGTGGLTDGSWVAITPGFYVSGNEATLPKTVTIDLRDVSKIATVIVGVPKFGSTKTIAVSISLDGNTFTEVGRHEFQQAMTDRHNYKFTPTDARYVRLSYMDRHERKVGHAINLAFTTEVEVYAGE